MNYHFNVRLHVDVETYLVSPWFETLASACAFVRSKQKTGVSILGYEFCFALKSGRIIHPYRFGVSLSDYTPYRTYRSLSAFRYSLSRYKNYCRYL